MKGYITLICLLLSSLLYSQKNHLQILPSVGVVGQNLIGGEDKLFFTGWSVLYSVDLRLNRSFSSKSEINLSAGYLSTFNANIDPGWFLDTYANYASLKVGYLFKVVDKHRIGINISNYFWLEKELQFPHQKSYFGNLDLLYETRLSKRFVLGISTPITFAPFAEINGLLNNSMREFYVWGEWIGLQLYFGYKII